MIRMSTRSIVLLFLLLGLLAGGLTMVKQRQHQARLRDYANLVTDTHGRAIRYYDDARAAGRSFNAAMAAGQDVPPEQFAEAQRVFRKTAEDTRKEKAELEKVVPPTEAAELHRKAIEFLEKRAELADVTAEMLSLAEKSMGGQEVPASRMQDLQQKMARQASEVDAMAKDIAEKKDALLL